MSHFSFSDSCHNSKTTFVPMCVFVTRTHADVLRIMIFDSDCWFLFFSANMEYKSHCNGTHNVVCKCKAGYECEDQSCGQCVPILSTTNPTLPSTSGRKLHTFIQIQHTAVEIAANISKMLHKLSFFVLGGCGHGTPESRHIIQRQWKTPGKWTKNQDERLP